MNNKMGMDIIKSNIFPKLYIVWAILVILIVFIKDKLSHDNITHFLILIIFGLSLFVIKFFKPRNPRIFFILSCVILAALVEGAHMITNPVLPTLMVTKNITLGQFFYNYSIDLLLTVPVYFMIFWVVWLLINRYVYSKWEYIFLIALGQALGDGSGFFVVKPLSLIMVPYVLINYHAMNIAPFLNIQNYLRDKPKDDSRWKYIITPLILVVAYLIGGIIIKITAKYFKLS